MNALLEREDGLSSNELCALAGISYRQLDYWARIGVLRPELVAAAGSGSARRYAGWQAYAARACGYVGPDSEAVERVREWIHGDRSEQAITVDQHGPLFKVLDMFELEAEVHEAYAGTEARRSLRW